VHRELALEVGLGGGGGGGGSGVVEELVVVVVLKEVVEGMPEVEGEGGRREASSVRSRARTS
jgi:uncharacterized membrane protein